MAEDRLLQFFVYAHLPGPLQAVSAQFGVLAAWVDEHLPAGPERTVCLRKLLEAKDCAVRTVLEAPPAPAPLTLDLEQVSVEVTQPDPVVCWRCGELWPPDPAHPDHPMVHDCHAPEAYEHPYNEGWATRLKTQAPDLRYPRTGSAMLITQCRHAAPHYGYICDRDKGHAGPHVTIDVDGAPLAWWPAEEPPRG